MKNIKRRAFGTLAIAQMCQVTPPTIVRWLEEGHLPFFTTLGGHRKVWEADLAGFLRGRNIPLPEEMRDPGPRRVLIVDDEAAVRRLILRVLKRQLPGAEIHEAEDGFEAGRQLALLTPSLVILDVRLPGMDGYKVCRLIRSDPRQKDTKILTISGHNVEESGKRSLEAGADDFLGKPFQVSGLKRKIDSLLKMESGAGG